MTSIILRGRITNRKLELIDPIPEDMQDDGQVRVSITKEPHQSVNDYGDPVIVDDENGIIEPLEPNTFDELVDAGIIGMWEHQREEFGDTAEWVHNLRQKETKKAWQNRKLS